MSEQLTPEQIGKQAGDAIAHAIADGLEPTLLRMVETIATQADALAGLWAEVDHLRAEVMTLRHRLDNEARDRGWIVGGPGE